MPTAEDVRAEVSAFLSDSWDPDLTVAEWWAKLADSGFAVPTWPEEWHGRGYARDLAGVVWEEIAKAGVLGPPPGLGMLLAGPTILAHGTDAHKRRYLRPIVDGTEGWCQLFSEPGAGSDLASLQCRAVRDGDEWVVTGQKVWTSGGQWADVGMLIARTDPDVPKHRGITYFAIDMDQPAIDVRPLKEMTGRALFNEVFFDEARVPDSARIGDLNDGWAVTQTTLANERAGLGSGGGGAAGGAVPGSKAGMLGQRAGDFTGRKGAGGGMARIMQGKATGLILELAKQLGKTSDATIRQELMRLHTLNEIGRFTSLRSRAAMAAGRRPGPEANTAKLMMSQITRMSRDVGLRLLDANAMLMGRDALGGGIVQELALFSPAVSIYGGSDEIQRNIIGERVLGLPKEPGNDKDVPFRELRVGTQAG